MTQLQDLKQKARSTSAIIECPDCGFEEYFFEFLDRDGRVDEENEEVEFGCPSCGNDTVDLGQKRSGNTVVVAQGLGELEDLAGE